MFSKEYMSEILKEILALKNCDVYYDNNQLVRRIEQVCSKGKYLQELNERIQSLLREVFLEKFVIFKDKYNCKPPGGEGFYAHYDGVFIWRDEKNNKHQGWYEYAQDFINVLIAIDKCDGLNGTIEIAKRDNLNFEDCLARTKLNGTPEIKPSIAEGLSFSKILLNPGDVILFSHKCPHRSGKNNSLGSRRIIYYTYNALKYGDHYERYFKDKSSSNPGSSISKALSSATGDG
ncbi:MAG: phytanoyl-CoA dioxygenase family protein [Gammaproteobacteria bacterium]|nr:phytanoyl-CoA dioxygenase family protein [Gammaproteobacteria bacterium]